MKPSAFAMAACLSLGAWPSWAQSTSNAAAAATPSTSSTPSSPATPSTPRIAHERYVLGNGLPVLLHVDRSVPLVVLDVSYDVGSRDEAKGRTGFAHLFEHLMFMGTQRVPTKKFDAWMEDAGGWNNAWTSNDRTNYYDVAPPTALPLLLWLEADRMRDVGRLMTQQKLDAQRDVVRNERRQSYENRPYGKSQLRLSELLFPVGHPYHHPVIGSHADLEAATVQDVSAFFTQFYDPANAALIVAGDFEPAQIKPLIERYFAGIPTRGKPKRAAAPQAPTLGADVRETLHDDVEQPRLTLAWHAPAHLTFDDAVLDVVAQVLGQGPSSRLHEQLVVKRGLALDVSAHQDSRALSSVFEIDVTAKSAAQLPELEKLVRAQLGELAKSGLTEAELSRSRALLEHAFARRLESVRERASLLALYETEAKDSNFYAQDIGRYAKVSAADVQRVAREVLGAHAVVMTVLPGSGVSEGKGQ